MFANIISFYAFIRKLTVEKLEIHFKFEMHLLLEKCVGRLF